MDERRDAEKGRDAPQKLEYVSHRGRFSEADMLKFGQFCVSCRRESMTMAERFAQWLAMQKESNG